MHDANHRFAACRRGIVSKCSKTCSGNLSFEIGTALLRVAGRAYNLYAKAGASPDTQRAPQPGICATLHDRQIAELRRWRSKRAGELLIGTDVFQPEQLGRFAEMLDELSNRVYLSRLGAG
jgi:hypothetical protein